MGMADKSLTNSKNNAIVPFSIQWSFKF
jgi:hypothetical protein